MKVKPLHLTWRFEFQKTGSPTPTPTPKKKEKRKRVEIHSDFGQAKETWKIWSHLMILDLSVWCREREGLKKKKIRWRGFKDSGHQSVWSHILSNFRPYRSKEKVTQMISSLFYNSTLKAFTLPLHLSLSLIHPSLSLSLF